MGMKILSVLSLRGIIVQIMFRVIIAGGRDFSDFDMLVKKCSFLLKNKKDVEVVCGGARGADSLGKKFSTTRGHGLKMFPADWDKHGKAAGMIRNIEMAEYSDALIAFWDGQSRGTKHMIKTAKAMGLDVRVFYYKGEGDGR